MTSSSCQCLPLLEDHNLLLLLLLMGQHLWALGTQWLQQEQQLVQEQEQ